MSNEVKALSWDKKPFAELTRLAWPIALSMISYATMTLVDTFFVSWLGSSSLAGVSLAATAAWVLICFPFGFLQGTKILVSQDAGAGEHGRVGSHLGSALIWAGAIGLVVLLIGKLFADLLPPLTATPEAAGAATGYFNIRILGIIPMLAFCAMREVRQGLGDSRTPMIATVSANISNIVLDYLLIVQLGWGVEGAAWATVVANCIEAGVILFVQAKWGFKFKGMNRHHLTALWKLGWPTGTQFFVEMSCFTVLTIMISKYAETHMAAHQIVLQVIHFSFLPAFAIGEAVSILSGQAVGANRMELVKRVSRLAMLVTGVYTGIFTVILIVFGRHIAQIFSDDPQLIQLATYLFIIAAVLQLFDGANIIARGALKGTGDVRYPAFVSIIVAWVFTPPAMLVLGYWADMGAPGGWIGVCVELTVAAGLFWWRLERNRWQKGAKKAAEIRSRAA